MWKVILIICTLGNPCVIMEEDPVKFYSTKSECMANGSVKTSDITTGFQDYGFQIVSANFDCEQDTNNI